MRGEWWYDYKMVPYGDCCQYSSSLGLLQTLEKFSIVEVRPCYKSNPHEVVNIWVDDVYYDEDLMKWIERFK